MPYPDVPDGERWGTSHGPDYYPYVRTLVGISLFDFNEFDAVMYSNGAPVVPGVNSCRIYSLGATPFG